MKRKILALCVAVLLAGTFAGCTQREAVSDAATSESPIPQTSVPETPTVIEITEEELFQQFELVYNDCGAPASTSEEQLSAELESLKNCAAASEKLWPEDYETLYRSWRSEAIEARAASLKAEYEEIIASRPLYDYVHEGLCYADYVDFENDGKPELLLVTLSPNIDDQGLSGWNCSAELFGEDQGHAVRLEGSAGSVPIYRSGYDPTTVALVQKDGHVYIRSYHEEGRMVEYHYNGVENGHIVETQQTIADFEPSCEIMSSFDKSITYEEYEAIHSQYKDEALILESTSGLTPVQNRGILPDYPEAARRIAAFWEALNKESASYAKFIDVDGDGNQDLVLLESKPYSDTDNILCDVYCVYSWNGTELECVELNEGAEPMVGEDAGGGGLYRDRQSGDIYVSYYFLFAHGERTTFTSLTDSVTFSRHVNVPDEPTPEMEAAILAENARAQEEYEKSLTRFELLCGDKPWEEDSIEAARQQLLTE